MKNTEFDRSSQLFQKAAVFTDLHVGHKQNSRIHNEDCERFVDWFIAEAHKRNAETCLFLGDWSHQRAAINVASMNVSIRLLKKLNDNFNKVYFITGNHDLYYRDKRELNSVEYARDLPNFVMVDEHIIQGDVAIIPWLVGDEYKKIAKYKVKYLFGHLELPYFKMNAMVEMPDHGTLNASHLTGPEYVFSGHFHKRQVKNNIHYIGNAFPHNYSDVGDVDRGAMFLAWGETPEYVNWPDCPRYSVFSLKELLDNHQNLLNQYTHARVKLDISISYEEATFIKENFVSQYDVRELQLIPVKEETEHEGTNITFESVDQIVLQQIETLESNTIDKTKLAKIYNELEI
jgi:DNA repair exonuclease SbcCD nuclease subunit